MSPIKFNAPWDTLRHVIVGSSYSPKFYEPIKNTCIRDSLQKIAYETEEDYQNLVSTLEDLSIKVQRPVIDSEKTIMDYVNLDGELDYTTSNSFTLIPRPPMQPRDSILIVGEKFVATNDEISWFNSAIDSLKLTNNLITARSTYSFDAPLVTVIGTHLIVDCREHLWLADYMQQCFPDKIVIPVMIGGHNDAVFCPVAPGLIVSTYHHTNYTETFPGWEVKFIENQSWNAIPGWRNFKHGNVNKWWVPDSDNNTEFANFVDTWLTNWMGYVQETVFDVNMLQINANTVLVNNYNQEMFDWFKIKKIDPIIVPFRHRFFWDGGIHCITSDLYREGDPYQYL
jgi:hypothetical protein